MKYSIVLLVLVSLSTSSATGQECSKELSLVNSLFEKLNVEQALADPNVITAEFDNLKNSLGDISLMSLKKDAPKLMFLNGKEKKGNAKPGKKRVYVTSLIQKKAFSISFNSLNEQVDSQLIICSHAKNGKIENLESVEINSNSASGPMVFDFTGLRGKVLSITIRNTSKEEKLAYRIKGAYHEL